ncbi:MAG: hypothetical protein ABI204_06415, partial [Ginsengibacter sp.]
MEKTADKRIVFAIGIIAIVTLFFLLSTFTTPFLLKISGQQALNGFLFFINRLFIWLALILLWLYAKNIEKESLLIWPQQKQKFLFSILAVFAI